MNFAIIDMNKSDIIITKKPIDIPANMTFSVTASIPPSRGYEVLDVSVECDDTGLITKVIATYPRSIWEATDWILQPIVSVGRHYCQCSCAILLSAGCKCGGI